jgi:PAS domain S-box-containing protein
MAEQQNMSGSYAMQRQQGGYPNQNDPGWIERVLEEMKDMLVLLNAQGRITYASPSAKQITGRAAKQLEGSHLSHYIHEDDGPVFLRDMDDAVAHNQPFRAHVRFQKTNNTYCLVEIYGHPHIASHNAAQGRHSSTEERCTGFFLMCRPYPTKNSQLLDSFLEHKIENARLVQQIAKLKQEEEEEANLSRLPGPRIDDTKSMMENAAVAQIILSDQESSETAAPNSNSNSDDSDNNSGDFFAENPPVNEGISHIDGIEVMTGLYYGDGERSQGLSTGVRKGRLVHCDIDITTAADQARNAQEGDRRKRLKGQHRCGDCGTADSPEWRKGPNGPKTLCNACGLRWSKKEKRRQESA